MARITVGLAIFLNFLGGCKKNSDTSGVRDANVAIGSTRGFEFINREITRSLFQKSKWSSVNALELMLGSSDLRNILGVFGEAGDSNTMRGTELNPVNYLVWDALFFSLASKIAECDQIFFAANFNEDAVEVLSTFCQQGKQAVTAANLRNLWDLVLGVVVSTREQKNWIDYVLTRSPTFRESSPNEVTKALVYSLFSHPEFLIKAQ